MNTKLKVLLRKWKKREKEYMKHTLSMGPAAQLDRARYEGIYTGTLWCIEDLEKLIAS